jgi:hypothetical protein
VISAETLLRSLVNEPLATVVGRQPNTVLEVRDGEAYVATTASRDGKAVKVAWLQELLDGLGRGEEVQLKEGQRRFMSSFLAAVLSTLPMVSITDTRSARTDPNYPLQEDVLAELEKRLGMYASLIERGGPGGVAPTDLREIGIYGGAAGIWTDARRTRGIGDANAVAVGLLHTGRHYPDDLSDAALLYHYPDTDRAGAHDRSEIDAVKAACRLQLPVFVVLSEGARRSVRKGWVATWDDPEELFLVEFAPKPVRVEAGDTVDDQPFDLFDRSEKKTRLARDRPNQQRFHIQVVQRYGGQCALCGTEVTELIHAAHLVGDAEHGSNDPRNGLPLCSNHHLALDRHLIAIEPKTGAIFVRDYSAAELGVTVQNLSHLPKQPATSALKYRWELRSPDGWSPARPIT